MWSGCIYFFFYLLLACWWILASGIFNVLMEAENQVLANFSEMNYLIVIGRGNYT